MTQIRRDTWLETIHAAFIAGRPDTARNLATDWLTFWPGDSEVTCLLARAEYDQNLAQNALARLKKLWITNPEYLPAYELAASVIIYLKQFNLLPTVNACIAALKNTPIPEGSPSWAAGLSLAYAALNKQEYATAAAAVEDVLALGPDLPLPTWIAARIYAQSKPPEILEALLLQTQDRWPECVPVRLLLGQMKMRSGETSLGVELLHQAAAEDPAGEAAAYVFDLDNPYRNLWPSSLNAQFSSAIPAQVSAVLGDNLLTETLESTSASTENSASFIENTENQTNQSHAVAKNGSSDINTEEEVDIDPADLPQPEPWEAFQGPRSGDESISGQNELEEIKAEFEQLAQRLKVDRTQRADDGRKPAYIILSSRTRLVQTLDDEGFERINKALVNLVLMMKRRPAWNAHILFIDDPNSLSAFQLAPADPGNAWQIKLRLADLDQALRNQGEMIGALLIVGSDKVIPFHQLPNPTDDDDDVILSDNPYGTTDENYYAPEWPVGRFPSDQIDELLKALTDTAEYHRNPVQKTGIFGKIRNWISRLFGRITGNQTSALGYSADIWRKAAMDVFRVIGSPRSLQTSPPVEAGPYPPDGSAGVRFSYFNLHGLEDSPEWFGQRDPFTTPDVEEFPVALRPDDILNSGSAPEVIFTEACYGANTVDKTSESAISLRFLASGSKVVVGSTKISYGSVNTPLIAADLLSKLFWINLKQRIPAGEALRQARLRLAAEMHERQGFLDGEDQKTLISFVLFGDPLFTAAASQSDSKTSSRSKNRPASMKVVSTSKETVLPESEFDPMMLTKVKTIMASYLPGMSDAECVIHSPIYSHIGQGIQASNAKLVPGENGQHYIFTFSKDIRSANRIHSRFARVTIDHTGKIMKLVVSK
ncbi:MAG: hypothetical protein JXA25_02970 [Anaerolineales bacterium]|nr:hypothetical protein [Anaerolineales bacterium]